MVTPLKRILSGPLSSALASACGVAEGAFTTAALLAARLAREEFRVDAVVFTSAEVAAASLAFTLASVAREFAAAAASRASSIWRSRLANSSFSSCSCSCWAWSAWRNSSISAAISALLLAGAGFAAVADFAGCASASFDESFGESANVVPVIRNNDSVSAASFLIASLFLEKNYGPLLLGKAITPVPKVEADSYAQINYMLIVRNKSAGLAGRVFIFSLLWIMKG